MKFISVFIEKINLNKVLIILSAVALILVVMFIFWWNKKIEFGGAAGGGDSENKVSSIAGLECENYSKRSVSVMLASDVEARPLYGISQADMVFEMPVAPNGITRLMAVYQCEEPKEIGSVRSSRQDFIPLAAGLKSIYAHWGGEYGALEKLNSHVIDNLNAMTSEGTTYYRKPGIKPPHNGFTNFDRILDAINNFKYDFTDSFAGYPHSKDKPSRNISNIADIVEIDYAPPWDAKWAYDKDSNIYKKNRSGEPEIDKNNGQQVSASVVVKMITESRFLRDQYIEVDTQGKGDAQIYQNGIAINGSWEKNPAKLDSKLYFYDEKGNEIKFVPGKIWVEIVTK